MSNRLILAAALAVAMPLSPAAAEVVSTTDDGFVTRDTAEVAAGPLAVWLALTKPGDWWNSEHTWSGDAANITLTPQAGGCLCERLPGDDGEDGFAMDGSAHHATVVQAFPLRVLRLRGGLGPLQGEPATGILTITLKEIAGGTRVLWEYNVGGPMRYEIDQISGAVDGVMSQQLAGLRDHLGPLGPGAAAEGESDSDPQIEAEATLEDQIDALGGVE
ncbi:MAG: SRPBCC family protein [Alphaproteobacteria bacterium]|nr:SRPBCC family protein [Alphaproteobacteria bacterium]MBU1756527.1 SRPBCC family protein [Alphaproteobacteria bacterium]